MLSANVQNLVITMVLYLFLKVLLTSSQRYFLAHKICNGCLLTLIISCVLNDYMFLNALQVQQLIAELNEILAHDIVDDDGLWKKKLTSQSLELFEFLPQAIQEQLMLERDPHGNVQVQLLYLSVFCCDCQV